MKFSARKLGIAIFTISLGAALGACKENGTTEEQCESCPAGNTVYECYGGLIPSARRYKGPVCSPSGDIRAAHSPSATASGEP